MQSNFIEFISHNYQPDLGNCLKDALVIFDSYNVNDHEFPLQNILYGSMNHLETAETLDRFYQTVQDFLVTLSDNFGLVFAEDADLPAMVRVFETLLSIEYYIDHDQVLRIFESDNPPMETLASVFELVSNVEPSWTFSNVLDVQPALLSRMQERHSEQSKTEEPVMAQPGAEELRLAQQIENLKLYQEFTNDRSLVCFKLVRRGNLIGADFKRNIEFIKNHLEFSEEEALARELIGILYFSGDTCMDPIMGFRTNSEYLFDDLKKITHVDSHVSKIVSDFLNFKNTRKPRDET